MSAGLSTKNKLHVSWSDSSFFPWLNPTSVLDYFCDTRNPFYSSECNNQLLKMQGIGPEQLSSMIGFEYQLYLSQPPLYVIRKVQRTSQKEVIPIHYYYVLHGVVYQAPDLMSVISARLQMASFYLEECLDTAFSHYNYNPSRGYFWDFNQTEETTKKDLYQSQRSTNFQRERVDLLLQEFVNRFPPFKMNDQSNLQIQQQQQAENTAETTTTTTKEEISNQTNSSSSADNKNSDQPAEKKMKLNLR